MAHIRFRDLRHSTAHLITCGRNPAPRLRLVSLTLTVTATWMPDAGAQATAAVAGMADNR